MATAFFPQNYINVANKALLINVHWVIYLLLVTISNSFIYIYIYIYILFIYLFIFGCVGSSLLCVGFSPVVASGGQSSLRCSGFSLQGPLPLRSTGSRRAGLSSCGSRALEHRLSSCGAQAQLLRSMRDPPEPGLEPMSPALAGGLSTTAPPGKPLYIFYI